MSETDSIAQWLDQLDPAELRDATHFRQIIAAKEHVEKAKQDLADAVAAARAAGDSWAIIGTALGTSRQNAQQQYGSRQAKPLPTFTGDGPRTMEQIDRDITDQVAERTERA